MRTVGTNVQELRSIRNQAPAPGGNEPVAVGPGVDAVPPPALHELLLFLPAGWLPGPSHPNPGRRPAVAAAVSWA